MRVQPIPANWIQLVTDILDEGKRSRIEWTITAEQAWAPFGRESEAYDLLIETLGKPGIVGYQVVGMQDHRDGSYADCWAFLCRHPWGSPVPLYTKIGVHHTRVYLNLFSLHVDDGSAQLEQAIKAYQLKKNR